MTLIVKEIDYAQSVTVRGYFRGGASLDPPGKEGLGALTITAMSRGTRRRRLEEINLIVDSIGGSLQVSCGRHLASFGGKCLAEDFDLLTELLTDSLLYPALRPDEVETARSQLMAQLKRANQDPSDLAERSLRESLYSDEHPYGRSIRGTNESLARLSRDDVIGFYEGAFDPRGGAIVVVGNVDAADVRMNFERSLGRWQPEIMLQAPPVPDPPVLKKSLFMKLPAAHSSQSRIMLGVTGPTKVSEDFYAAHIGDLILGQANVGGRIGRTLRCKEGLAYEITSRLSGGLGPGPWFISAAVDPNEVDLATDIILAEVELFCRQGVSDAEMSNAKSYLIGKQPVSLESSGGIAATLLDLQMYGRADDYVCLYPSAINKVTKDDVRAVARKYFSDQQHVLVIVSPRDRAQGQG